MKKIYFGLAAVGLIVTCAIGFNKFNGDVDFNGLKIGGKSFGDDKVLLINDDLVGDKATIVEFDGIRKHYRETGKSSSVALSDFSKLIINDNFTSTIIPLKDFESTDFFKEYSDRLSDDPSFVGGLELLFGAPYDVVKELISITEMRSSYPDYLMKKITNSGLSNAVIDSVSREITTNEYFVDFSLINDVYATEDDFIDFYRNNDIYDDDILTIDKYLVRGVKSREDVDKFATGDFESVSSRVMDYDHDKTIIKVGRSELGGVKSASSFDKGSVFIDDEDYSNSESIYVYIVVDNLVGGKMSESEAREKIKPLLTKNKKIAFVNDYIEKTIADGGSLSDVEYLKVKFKNKKYNIVDDFDSPIFEQLVGLVDGDTYSFNSGDVFTVVEIIGSEKMKSITSEHIDAIKKFYDDKMFKSIINVQNNILFDGVNVKSYNFNEF